MILLTDHIDKKTIRLRDSLEKAGTFGPEGVTILLSIYDGFLPDRAISPYSFYLYGEKMPDKAPVFFNRLKVPDQMEIRSTTRSGEVLDLHRKRAKLFYAEPKEKRQIKIVDWYDEDGKVRFSDHYDVYGNRFAQTVLNENEKPLIKTYYTPGGREKIVENLETGHIFLWDGDDYRIFRDKTGFIAWFMEHSGLNLDTLFINSLGLPYRVSLELDKRGIPGRDFLFWQEKMKKGIPGNMQDIFRGETKRLRHVFVQDMDSLEILRASVDTDPSLYTDLGYVYDYEKENAGTPRVLICTNSDQVEHLENLAKDLPAFTFYVAAPTEMSSKLMDLTKYENVKLFPNVKKEKLDQLFADADYYLDINHGSEVFGALERAYLHDHIIIAFEETVHSREYVAPEIICGIDEYQVLVNTLKLALTEADYRKELLDLQREYAMSDTLDRFRDTLEGTL